MSVLGAVGLQVVPDSYLLPLGVVHSLEQVPKQPRDEPCLQKQSDVVSIPCRRMYATGTSVSHPAQMRCTLHRVGGQNAKLQVLAIM